MVKPLNNIAVRIPGSAGVPPWPPQDVFVNFRIVDSSNVERVGWDHAGNMYVVFKGGAMYVYLGVSRQRVVACAYSRSVGHYINAIIKPNYKCVRLH